MKKRELSICLLFVCFTTFGQKKINDQATRIVDEGKKLYKSEMASWYGSDLFLSKFSHKANKAGGYVSYSLNDVSTCIFFSKGDNPTVLCTINFDQSYSLRTAIVDSIERQLSPLERELIVMRKIAKSEITKDTLFKTYSNTSLNLIPIIENEEKKVFVLTGPKKDGIVIFGNDYLLTFDKDNNLLTKKNLHKNIITINYTNEGGSSTMHSHLPETGDLITSTDICTLMLYEKFAKWRQHYVISKNYVSVWTCETNELLTLTMKAWKKSSKKK